jgi:hypothetical protein
MSCRIEPKFKEKWLVALRSDIYGQVRGRLGDGANGRCCLGVGADVAGVHSYIKNLLDGNDEPEDEESKDRLYRDIDREYADDDKYDFPSSDMLKRMGGLDAQEAHTLAEMNDSGETFKYIAAYIEENM